MSLTQIDGGRQIKSATITNAQIAAAAGIVNSKFATFNQDQNVGGFKLTNLGTCTSATDAANKAYVDGLVQGISNHLSTRVGSTAAITVTYTATGGTSARGQITAAPNTIDGVSLAANDRLLLKDQATGAQNGIWVVSTLGTGSNGIWDRATDFDNESKVPLDTFVFIQEGTVNSDSGWVLTNNTSITIGGASGTALTWSQFSGAGSVVAGAGLTKTGNSIDVIAADTSLTVAADSVGVNLASGGTLAISSGLKVAAAGITATEINASVAGGGIAGGSGTVLSIDYSGLEIPSGTLNGSNTAFTIAATPYISGGSTSDPTCVKVYLNGVLQGPTTEYTRSGTTITFTTAPVAGDELYMEYFKA